MRKYLALFSILCPLGSLLAQPPSLNLPKPMGALGDPGLAAPASPDDILLLYTSKRSAGLVAFRVGYENARRRATDRSIDLFLEALKREPTLVKALFNLGVECSLEERWNDALKFYDAYQQQPNVDPKNVTAEIRRVTAVSKLDASRRAFLKQFLPLIDEKDPNIAITKLGSLSKQYPKEWEASALTGQILAQLGRYQESLDPLREAARRAGAEVRAKLTKAADLAQKEVDFNNRVKSADLARENSHEPAQYIAAAQLYSEAWNLNPARADLMMNAATANLMADKVEPAVGNLNAARNSADPEISARATRMLKELGAINPDAATFAAARPNPSQVPSKRSTAELMVEQIGPMKTTEILLAVQPAPELLEENSDLFPMKEDRKCYGDGTVPEFKSTDSIWDIYQRNVQEAEARRQAALAASQPAPADVAASPAASSPSPAPATIDRGATGPLQTVSVNTDPPGAKVVVDESAGNASTCSSPCPISLPVGSRHTLLISLDGYRDERKILTVERGGQNIAIKLQEKSAMLRLRPSPGVVRLDGTVQATPAEIRVRAGVHEITVEVNGEVFSQKVVVEDQVDQTLDVKVDKK